MRTRLPSQSVEDGESDDHVRRAWCDPGDKKEPSSAPVKASSRRGAEPGHGDRAAQAAIEKPAEAKTEALPNTVRTAVAELAGSAPKVGLHALIGKCCMTMLLGKCGLGTLWDSVSAETD